MNKYWIATLLPLLSLLLMGCPYDSKIPLSNPEQNINKQFLGTWESEDEVYNTYTISPLSARQYSIVQKTMTGDIHKYIGFISVIRGALFLNAYSDSTKTYFLYRLKFDAEGNEMKVMPFAKNLPEKFEDFPKKLTDTQALNNFVWRNMNLRGFYDIDEQATYKKRTTLN
jgi:hypothetical protein